MADEGRRAFEEWFEEAARPDTAFVARGTRARRRRRRPSCGRRRSGTIQAVDTAGLTALRQRAMAVSSSSATPSATSCRSAPRSSRSTGSQPPAAASAAPRGHGGARRRADDRAGPGVRHPGDGRRRDPGALARRERPDDGGPGHRPPRRVAADDRHRAETRRDGPSPATITTGVIMPVRTWPDILPLGVTEIREYGGDSVQVVRRLHALLEELRRPGPPREPGRRRRGASPPRRHDRGSSSATASTWTWRGIGTPRASAVQPGPERTASMQQRADT